MGVFTNHALKLKLTCGTSYVTQCQRYGDCYILPTCGNIRIDELTEGDLQKAIDVSFRKRSQKKNQRKPISNQPLSQRMRSSSVPPAASTTRRKVER